MSLRLLSLSFVLISGLAIADEQRLTLPVLLMGDSQEHERHGSFAFVAGHQADKISKVAARSPQQDLFAKYSMAEIISDHISNTSDVTSDSGNGIFAIHLGDFLDISCQSEWRRFLSVAEPGLSDGRLVLGLGNHDGFYIGIFSFSDMRRHSYVGGQSWRDRCDAGVSADFAHPDENIMHKGKLVRELVKILRRPDNLETRNNYKTCHKGMTCGSLKISSNWTAYYQYPSKLDAITGPITLRNSGEYWRSYFVSEVKLPSATPGVDARIIILDPSQSAHTEESIQNAIADRVRDRQGVLYGDIQDEQRALIVDLLGSPCSAVEPVADCIRILAGHHPLDSYSASSKNWLMNLMTRKVSVQEEGPSHLLGLYISAHTHDGFIRSNASVAELNVGAIIEHSPQYRTFSLYKSHETGRYTIHTKLHRLTEDSDDRCAQLGQHWSFLPEFSSDLGTTMYENEYSYLEQSRLAFLQMFGRVEEAQKSGNQAAKEVLDPDSKYAKDLMNIQSHMLSWSKAVSTEMTAIGNRCVYKKDNTASPQTAYWDASNYGTTEGVETLLENMKMVTRDLRGKDRKGKQCYGGNAKDEHYLAYTEARFLGVLQDWFEELPDSAFEIKNQSTVNYRAYSARCSAAKSDTAAEYEIKQSAFIDRIELQ